MALEGFLASGGVDFKTADTRVRGIDRPPTNALDGVVDALTAQARQSTEAEHMRIARQNRFLMFFLAVIYTVTLILGIRTIRSFRRGIRLVTDQLTEIASGRGDLTARIPITSEDEISQLSGQFNLFADKLHALMKDIRNASGNLAAISSGASASSTQAESNSHSQAEKTQQIATAMHEIAITSQHASQVATSSQESAQAALACGQIMEKSLGAIQGIASSSETVAKHITRLGGRSEEIGKIAAVISEIAGQNARDALDNSGILQIHSGNFSFGRAAG